MQRLKRKTFFWLGILLFVLIVAGWGYYLYNKPHGSAADSAMAFSIGADSLFSQYQNDEKGADEKYLGKVIEVKGKLAEIQHSGASEIWMLSAQAGVGGGGAGTAPGVGGAGAAPGVGSAVPGGGGINCQLFSADKAPSPLPHPGDLVTIKGRCTGFLMDVDLVDCIVEQ